MMTALQYYGGEKVCWSKLKIVLITFTIQYWRPLKYCRDTVRTLWDYISKSEDECSLAVRQEAKEVFEEKLFIIWQQRKLFGFMLTIENAFLSYLNTVCHILAERQLP